MMGFDKRVSPERTWKLFSFQFLVQLKRYLDESEDLKHKLGLTEREKVTDLFQTQVQGSVIVLQLCMNKLDILQMMALKRAIEEKCPDYLYMDRGGESVGIWKLKLKEDYL